MEREALNFSIDELNRLMENESPQKLLEWAHRHFSDQIILACSFGAEDVVLVDMVSRITASPKIFYLDTDKHFQETYDTRDWLAEKYRIEFVQMKAKLTLDEQAKKYGKKLWEKDPNLCCLIRKVEPLKDILKQHKAWITGIRREQSITRAHAQLVEWDESFGLVKVNPLVFWNTDDVWDYIKKRNVPYNPLHNQNYPSIGCSVCTKPVKPGEDPRSGRWAGTMKTECGLHRRD